MSLGEYLDGEFQEVTADLQNIRERLEALEGDSSSGRSTSLAERVEKLEQVYVHFMSESIKQWTEERLRALEAQVKELRGGKRPEANNVSGVADVVQGRAVPVDLNAAIKQDLRQAGFNQGDIWKDA